MKRQMMECSGARCRDMSLKKVPNKQLELNAEDTESNTWETLGKGFNAGYINM